MADFLREFVRKEHAVKSLTEFASRLSESLNSFVPASLLCSERSGIHLAGIVSRGLPEFWFIRNVDDSENPSLGKYVPREDFLSRDARAQGFDGEDPKTLPPNGRLYRNGDIVSHVAVWEVLDNTLGTLLSVPQFRGIRTPEEYAKWIRFKMEVLIHFHRRFETELLVGGQIDVITKYQQDAQPAVTSDAQTAVRR
jgi:hypothetical protein